MASLSLQFSKDKDNVWISAFTLKGFIEMGRLLVSGVVLLTKRNPEQLQSIEKAEQDRVHTEREARNQSFVFTGGPEIILQREGIMHSIHDLFQ